MDAWERLGHVLSRRIGARLALILLALLYSAAIYAPLIASDRPYWIETLATVKWPAQPETRWPLFESISAAEVFFMALWALVLASPLWNGAVNRFLLDRDRDRIRRARRAKVIWALVLALAATLAWKLAVEGRASAASPWKAAIASGEIAPARVRFPPIAMGFAETNMAEAYRPPTWVASSEISEEGRYVRGFRAPRPDPVTGYVPPPAPVEVRAGERARNSPWRHPLGTDSLGRDLLVRILWGGRVSLSVGLLSAAVLFVLGVLAGAVAGYFGGWVDLAISRLIEVVLCFPILFLVLLVLALSKPDVVPPVVLVAIVIALVGWTGVARLVRAEFLKLREAEFVLAARALGFSPVRTILRHVLPNAIGPALVAASFAVASGVLIESALSFLGFGVQHPIPSWGSLVNESRNADHWWIQLFPGLCIFVTVVGYNLVGEAIRDALDPRLQPRPVTGA